MQAAQPGGWRSRRSSFAVAALLLAACAGGLFWSQRRARAVVELTPQERSWLDAHGPVRFAPDPAFAPIEWIDENGAYRGLAADYLALIQERLGVSFVIVRAKHWEDALRMARERQVDGLPCAQATAERSAWMTWSTPLFDLPDVLIVRQDYLGTPTLEELDGRRVAFTAGNAMIAEVRRRYPRILITEVADEGAALREVAFGHADAAQVNLAVASYLIGRQGLTNLKYASEGAGTAPLTIATRNDAPLLASIIAKGLAAVTPAEREELRRRWIRLDDPGTRLGRSLIAALAVTVGLALLVTLVVLAWNGTLRRRVAETTAGLQAELAERRRAEEALVRVQRLESLSVLAGGIAHDFNNLLTGILANISMAREEPSPPPGELSELLVDAESAARRAQALTRQLLTFSKGGAPVTRLVNLLPLVQESALFAARGTAATCTVRAPADLWPAEVDPGQIGQVVQNLVINAVEAMTSGGAVEVTLENRTLATATPGGLQPGPFVLLRVRDQGKGVAAELLPRIFDPFFSTKQRGSGLGLAVTHSVVVRHGGAIEASSQVGRGTTFEILLPASPGRVSAQQADPARAQQRCGRVLVMDDEEMLRRVAARIIGSLGCEVVAAAEGAEAIARWEQARAEGRPFDAVVVDLTVRGGLGGVETLRRLREQDPGVRVVVSSGYSEASEMASHAAHGFAAVLPKPYSAEDARAAIGPLLPLA